MKLFKFGIILFAFLLIYSPSYGAIYEVDATKNATLHNNVGMNHFNEGFYYGAIQEFKIAISLNPNTQGSAVYYDNLGRTYLVIGYPTMAEDCFLQAIRLNPMNLAYRRNLAVTYRRMGKLTANTKIKQFLNSKNPLDSVNAGLLYIEKGDIQSGIIKLDEFCINNPNLILTEGIKTYLKTLR